MDITVVIPCIYYHLKHIPNLLYLYQNQTLLPYEIILCVNGVENINNLDNIENLDLKYKLRVLKLNKIQSAGYTRQYASEKVTTKYIVYQDADDIPHKQRIEIIDYFFKERNADHIVHLYSRVDLGDRKYVLKDIANGSWKKRTKEGGSKTFGNISIKKEIIENISWIDSNRAEDLVFTDKILEKYNRCIKVGASLLYYRRNLSSFIKDNQY